VQTVSQEDQVKALEQKLAERLFGHGQPDQPGALAAVKMGVEALAAAPGTDLAALFAPPLSPGGPGLPQQRECCGREM
jgi:hypothetical protein